jgi:hypothetical protein
MKTKNPIKNLKKNPFDLQLNLSLINKTNEDSKFFTEGDRLQTSYTGRLDTISDTQETP